MADQVEKKAVLIVGDTPTNIQILMETLKNDYRIFAAVNGERALQLANAYPPPDIILLDIMMPGGDCREWAHTHGAALGFMEDIPYKEETVNLEPGQALFLYTDGVTEATSPDDQLFGLEKLQASLKRCHDQKLDELCTGIEASLAEFQQGEQFDDITMLALKRIS